MINPFKKWYCYSCGKQYDLGLCDIYNWETGKEVRKAPTGWLMRLRARYFIEILDGPENVRNFACRKCPHCQELLPRDVETARNIVIAVLGDVTVGKTHYIAACIDQMSLRGSLRYLTEVVECLALNQKVEQKYRSTLYDPVFQHLEQLSATLPVQIATEEEKLNKPLIYRLKVRKAPHLPQEVYNLIFYDAAGEDLANQSTLVNYKSYALDPDAIIYIADPLTIPGIEKRTPYKEKLNRREPDYALRWTIDLVRPYKRIRQSSLTIPIAITLSKSDLLTYVESENTPFSFLKEPNYVGGLDMNDIENMNREVKDLLENYGAFGLLHADRLSENVSFFATSATGCAPNPDTRKFDRVTPRRCLDPLLWILFTLGVINKKGDQAFTGPSQAGKWER